jgi:hypothetical protein
LHPKFMFLLPFFPSAEHASPIAFISTNDRLFCE